jgi:hypothetical protein
MDEREIEEYCSNTVKWFKSDHLSFYTDWSQMYYPSYDDSHDVFSLYTASGEMTSMVQWFNESRSDFDDSDINVAKICSCIWKRIHPPSYLLYRRKKIEASPDQNGYDTASFRNKVHNAHALWTLVLKPFWELPKKQRQVRLEERITKFRLNFYTLLWEQSRGLTKWKPYRDRPSSSLSPLVTAPLDGAVVNDSDMAANEITPADNNTMSSDPDSDDGDG